jgi:hypothetical protein
MDTLADGSQLCHNVSNVTEETNVLTEVVWASEAASYAVPFL